MRIGYAINPYKKELYNQRRRFPFFSKKLNLKYEIANFDQTYDYVIINASSDLSIWLKYNKGKLIFEYLNSSLDEKLSLKVLFRGLAKFIFRRNKFPFINQKKLIRNICKKSYAVVCNSFEQYLTLRKLNKNIYIILDSHNDIPFYRYEINNFKKINLIWEGQAENLGGFINFCEIIKNSNLKNKIKIFFITDLFFYKFMKSLIKVNTQKYLTKILQEIEFEVYEWTIENLIKYSKISHAAIIPFQNKNMDIFKSENKLHIFWKLGLPVISSMNYSYEREMKKFNINLIVKQEYEWIEKINNLFNSQFFLKNKKKLPNLKYFEDLEKTKLDNWKKILCL